jgi:hypothetical protein
MTMFDPNATTAAVTAATGFALLVGHMGGDMPVQREADAVGKGQPTDDQLAAGAHPWTGWGHLTRHVTTYLICQAIALAVTSVVAPLTIAGAIAALAVSGCTHAVIDRRWIVRAIVRSKGGCAGWEDAHFHIDQALHFIAIGAAAVVAALVTTAPAGACVVALAAGLVAAGLVAERHRAAGIVAPSDRH